MEEKELHQIVKFKRELACWLCPECGMENTSSHMKCTVCTFPKTADAPILKAWTPEDDIVIPPKNKGGGKKISGTKGGGGPFFSDGDTYAPPKPPKKSGGVFWKILLVLIVAGILIAVTVLDNYYSRAAEYVPEVAVEQAAEQAIEQEPPGCEEEQCAEETQSHDASEINTEVIA